MTETGEQVSFLERIFQGLGITFGFIGDGLTATGIVLKVLTGNFFVLASAVNSALTVSINHNPFDALVSVAHRIGTGVFEKST